MSVLLYAVIPARAAPAQGYGIDGMPLRTLPAGGVQAVVSEHAVPPERTLENLLAYEQVIERLMGSLTLLPARFGTTAGDQDEMTTLLARRAGELTASLQRVEGAVEIAVRRPANAEPAPSPGTGSAYMYQALHRHRAHAALQAQLKRLARATAPRGESTAFLVDRERIPEFVRRATSLGLTATGPWPPYSFTGPGPGPGAEPEPKPEPSQLTAAITGTTTATTIEKALRSDG